MIFPTVHLNGTSKGELLEQLLNAHEKVTDAMQALSNACPNARDYYVQPSGDEKFREALEDHRVRMQKLADVKKELDELAFGVSQQGRKS